MSLVMMSVMRWILIVIPSLLSLSGRTYCVRLADIYWNSTNPIFRIDNTDHIIDVNKGNVAYEYDQVNIICPMYNGGTREEDIETYIIYNVSKEEYDTCRITNHAEARTIAVCDMPFKTRYFTITFRPFTPQPGGLEFRPGQDYYFISLSPKEGGERCGTHHMKVVFKVCCKNSHKLSSPPLRVSTQSSVNVSNDNKTLINSSIIINKSLNESSTTQRPPRLWTTRTYAPNVVIAADINVTSNRVSHDQNGHRIRGKNTYLHANPNNKHRHNHNNNSIVTLSLSTSSIAPPSSSSSSSMSTSTTVTPYWWRPHFTKLPSLKHNYDIRNDQQWPSSKKKTDRDKLPNDTRAKNSELVNGAPHCVILRWTFVTVTVIVPLLLWTFTIR